MKEASKISKSATALAEEEMLKLWATEKIFEKSLKLRKKAPYFSFNDGPPFANGSPHFGHSLVTAIKDSMLRYKAMRGYYVPRRNGWDCHGLPVEYSIEKQFGVSGKQQILELGLKKFNAASRASIFKYKADWEEFLSRIGRWSDYEHYYATVDTDYTESVWWILSEINKKGLLYRGFKSLPYCPRCATPLSNFELNEGYRDDVPDPSVYALFPLIDDPATKLLAWTTTPWTLPANAALAVNAKADYAYVKLKSDSYTLILAKKRLSVLDLAKNQYKLLKTVKGKQLTGLKYQPLYKPAAKNYTTGKVENAWQVLSDNNVSLEDGSGILHVAPRYGETDLNLGLANDLPLIESVDANGKLIFGPKTAVGKFFKDADEHIITDLTKKDRIFAAESGFRHTYPFCWRCDTPLMYFATTTWFVEVSKIRDKMLKTAEDINWMPAHIKSGRFGKWLEGARDWALSRNRYWGAPMPIWQNIDDENDYLVIGSLDELVKLAGQQSLRKLPKTETGQPDLHRPFIDDIIIKKDGKTYRRIEEVLDCWFESGSMPVAQWHYPFENKDLFAKNLPADFITEAIDQTRLWFYVQHVISTILFNQPAYKQVIVTGFMMAADGQKLSKRLRNYPPVEEVFALEGADALRLYLLSRTQGTENAEYMRFDRSAMADIKRNVIDTLTNSFNFFQTYAKVDGWKTREVKEPTIDNLLDQWIIARLNQTIHASTKNADSYKISHAILPVFDLIEDLSNWYIRRSRRRFWKSENDADKEQAYTTLHYVLTRICQLMAPWAPFISDKLWRELTKGMKAPISVHLSDWPSFAPAFAEASVGKKATEDKPSVSKPDNASLKLLEDMQKIRDFVINDGLSQRAAAGIKVRQPLAKVTVNLKIDNREEFETIIADELNVKAVEWAKGGKAVKVDTKLTPGLKSEGIMRELVRHIQNARKNAGLNVDDRIKLRLETDSKDVNEAIKRFKDTIFAETLATGELTGKGDHSETVKVEAQEVGISLSKA